jgi:hypothetical protein
MTRPVTNYSQSSDRYVGKLVYLHYPISLHVDFVTAAKLEIWRSRRLAGILKQQSWGKFPGPCGEPPPRAREYLIYQSRYLSVNIIEEKGRAKLYRGQERVRRNEKRRRCRTYWLSIGT